MINVCAFSKSVIVYFLINYNIEKMNNNDYNLRSFILNTENFPTYIPSRNELLHTETFNSLIQVGGKIQIKGLRYENNLSEVNDYSSDISEMYGGKRNKPSISDTLHQEAVDYLKDDLKLSPLEARAYKSLAYRHVKEKYPDADSRGRFYDKP